MTVLDYLEKTARAFPDKAAIVDEHGSFSFACLRDNALSVAGCIAKKLDNQARLPILVFMPKGKECVAAFMGIVYSGNIYTPLDIRFPFPKIQSVIDVLNPSLYVTDLKNAKTLTDNGVPVESVLIYEEIAESGNKLDAEKALRTVIDTNPVYVFFTSGSTGLPKGVIITHRNIVDYIEWAVPVCGINESTVMGNQSPFYFDISTQDIYSCLKTSASLVIIPERFFSFPVQALQFIKDRNINYLYWVPSAFISVCAKNALAEVDISCVRQMIFGGEVMPVKYLRIWQKHIPGLKAMNVYGPTEATVNITHYPVDRQFEDDELLPLGMPCGNTELLVLDEDDNLISDAFTKGELCARGACLSPGYWRDKAKTGEAFVQNPVHSNYQDLIYRTGDIVHYNEKGELMFDGRKDFQIKHLGYRIELAEIEKAALSVEGVAAAIADYDKVRQQIVMFYNTGALEEKAIQTGIAALLPKYMVPKRYVKLNQIPYNDNGKIDRRKLREEYIEA